MTVGVSDSTAAGSSPLLVAAQAALGQTYDAIYGYGVVGARTTGDTSSYALACLVAHERVRDALQAALIAAGTQPVAAAPAYALPFTVTSTVRARQLARRLENAVAGAMWDLIATTTADSRLRVEAVEWLVGAGVRAGAWGEVRALPGQPG